MESYALLLGSTLSAGTVLAIAALGLLINEKAGIVNLGAEGMMLCAAIAAFATVVHTGSFALGLLGGMAAGALLAALFGWLVIWLNTNQYATGLALSLFGVGFSAFVGIGYVQARLPDTPKFAWPVLGELPVLGQALFRLHPLVYLTMVLALFMVWFLFRTRAGLCCARWVNRPSRPMRWATRCAAYAWPPSWPAGRCAAWRVLMSPRSIRRCGSKAWWLGAAGSRWR